MSLFRNTENREEFCSKLFLLKSRASNKYVRKTVHLNLKNTAMVLLALFISQQVSEMNIKRRLSDFSLGEQPVLECVA